MKIVIKYDSLEDENFITRKVKVIIDKCIHTDNLEFFITIRGNTRKSAFEELTDFALNSGVIVRLAEVNDQSCEPWQYLDMYLKAIMNKNEPLIMIFITDKVDIIFDAFDVVIRNHGRIDSCLWYDDGQIEQCRVPVIGTEWLQANRDKCFKNNFTDYIKQQGQYTYYDHQLFNM